MLARTAHFQQAARRVRDRCRLDIALVMLTGLCAIAAGLAMNALSTLATTLGISVSLLPV